MTSEHWTDRLSEYLDGDLGEGDRETLELHLLECPACAELLAELRQIVGTASALDDRPPPRDLWPDIASRLTPRGQRGEAGGTPAVRTMTVAGEAIPLESRRRLRAGAPRVSLTVPQLLAAGIALVLFSAGGAWVALSPGAPEAPMAATTTPAGPDGAPATGAPAGTAATFAATYESAISDLESAFLEQRNRLDPETIRVVERNLAIIDAAIGDARAALEEDPSSGFLNAHLANAMRRKVDLLRQAAVIGRTES